MFYKHSAMTKWIIQIVLLISVIVIIAIIQFAYY